MKYLIIIVSLVFSFQLANAQFGIRPSGKDQFFFSTHIDPVASWKEKGFNQAFEIEYSGSLVYTKAGIEYFAGLPVTTYFDWHGALGINLFSGMDHQVRYYAGTRMGRIYRGSYGVKWFNGFEAGISIKVLDRLYLGLRATYDYRRDQELFNDPIFWRESGYISVSMDSSLLKEFFGIE